MERRHVLYSIVSLSAVIVIILVYFNSCSINEPKTKHLAEFHSLTSNTNTPESLTDNLALYVDYSNCIAEGMESPFYQKMVSPLKAATKEYWSIKGDSIKKELEDVYKLLNNIEEVNYAALDVAIEQMANRVSESVLLTDGELFSKTATKNNPNNPYMHDAFKKWLLKGHDIHIIAEPYQETYKGQIFDKKRFYIIFSDDRLEGNIYQRIKEIVNLEDFPHIDEFHLSGNYPYLLPINGQHSEPNTILAANVEAHGDMEIQDWNVDWKNIINLIINGYDDNGNPLPNGDKLIGGLKVNKNAFGSYRITDVGIRVYNINREYLEIYDSLENGVKVGQQQLNFAPIENFIIIDKDEFTKHGNVDLYFDINNFAPNGDLDGNPFNYFKIEIYVKDLQNILNNSLEMFNFDSIVNSGQTNVSISESLKNCVFDPELIKKLKGQVLYTIYVKSDKY